MCQNTLTDNVLSVNQCRHSPQEGNITQLHGGHGSRQKVRKFRVNVTGKKLGIQIGKRGIIIFFWDMALQAMSEVDERSCHRMEQRRILDSPLLAIFCRLAVPVPFQPLQKQQNLRYLK